MIGYSSKQNCQNLDDKLLRIQLQKQQNTLLFHYNQSSDKSRLRLTSPAAQLLIQKVNFEASLSPQLSGATIRLLFSHLSSSNREDEEEFAVLLLVANLDPGPLVNLWQLSAFQFPETGLPGFPGIEQHQGNVVLTILKPQFKIPTNTKSHNQQWCVRCVQIEAYRSCWFEINSNLPLESHLLEFGQVASCNFCDIAILHVKEDQLLPACRGMIDCDIFVIY